MNAVRKMGWLSTACAVGMILASSAGCGGGGGGTEPTASNPGGGGSSAGTIQLTGAGATFPYPLYSKWFDAYHQANPNVQVNYQSIGSGGGIQQLKNKTVDFGASDAPLSEEEQKEMPGEVLHLPTVAGAVVPVYNLPGGPEKLKLTPEALSGIYLGTVKKWNDPAIASANAGATLPDTPVVVVHRSDGSGTSFLFTGYLSAVDPEWKAKVGQGKSVKWPAGIGGKGNEGVTGQVNQTPGSIGYVELAYALQNNLKYAVVRNQAGQFVEPSVESTTAAIEGSLSALEKDVRAPIINASGAKAWPIAGLTYILVYKEQPNLEQAKALTNLLNWSLHDGQKMAPDLHYAPLPESVVSLNMQHLRSIQSKGVPVMSEGSGETAAEGAAEKK